MSRSADLRMAIACPGLGHIQRGYESFASEFAAALQAYPQIKVTVYSGAQTTIAESRVLPIIRRTSRIASIISRVMRGRYDAYEVEQLTFACSLFVTLFATRPSVLFLSDRLVAQFISRFRRFGLSRIRIVFSNGAPYGPPFAYADRVQQLTPLYYRVAVEGGESTDKHGLIPYGFETGRLAPSVLREIRTSSRRSIGIPPDALVILCAGHLSLSHKRLDYVIGEVASAGSDMFLLMVGQETSETSRVRQLATTVLGEGRYEAISLPSNRMEEAYAAADIFVLASIHEGFPRVVAEALAAGLPLILHDSELFRWIAREHARYVRMDESGALASQLRFFVASSSIASNDEASSRNAYARSRFDWAVLMPRYLDMILR